MATYTVTFRDTTAVTGSTGSALTREAAIAVAAQMQGTGPTGTEAHVYTCDQTAAAGPTGTYSLTSNHTNPLTGGTFSATGTDAACMVAAAAGPTGPGAGRAIFTVT